MDDTIGSGTTALAALRVLTKIGAVPVGLAFAMGQGDEWRSRRGAEQRDLVRFVCQTPHFMQDPDTEGWVPELSIIKRSVS